METPGLLLGNGQTTKLTISFSGDPLSGASSVPQHLRGFRGGPEPLGVEQDARTGIHSLVKFILIEIIL